MYSQGLEHSQSSNQQPTKLPSLASLHPQPLPQQSQAQPLPHFQQQSQHFHRFAPNNSQSQSDPPVKEEMRVITQTATSFSTNLRRGPWSLEEDKKLMESITIFGPSNWVRISQNLGSRTPKQCRERYHQNLKPSLNRNPITPEEGQLIEDLVLKHGKRWAEIARHLNGRSDNAIKNWWNGGANRRRRASSQAIIDPNAPNTGSSSNVSKLQGIPNDHEFKTPSFNTSMFANPNSGNTSQNQQLPLPPNSENSGSGHQGLALSHQIPQQQFQSQSRSASITQDMFQQPQGVKRLLEEQHNYPLRRHSTHTILTSTAGSTSPFSTTYSRTGGDSSRNSSISIDYNFHSNSTSRRSSLVNPDIYYLNNSGKRHHSLSSGNYLSPSLPTSHRNSLVTIPSGLTPLTPAFTQQHNDESHSQQQQQQLPQQPQLPQFSHLHPPNQHQHLFKPDFNFTKEGEPIQVNSTGSSINSSAPSLNKPNQSFTNPDFKGVTVTKINDNSLKQTTENEKSDKEGENQPKTVMNISNLLS